MTASRTSPTGCAVVAGSLGKANLGDDALVAAFIAQHRRRYATIAALLDGPHGLRAQPDARFAAPPFPLGRRFWRGFLARRRVRREIRARCRDGWDYVWLGGLLGTADVLNRLRAMELRWARSFAGRIVYYFGDAADGFATTESGRRLARQLNRGPVWIAVRSREAADELRQAGVEHPVRVGLDPVLYERIERRGLPFSRTAPASRTVVLVPSVYREREFSATWQATALAAQALGLDVRWLSLCDPEDLTLCERLADDVSRERPETRQQVVSAERAESALVDAAVCVATRFHALIFAMTVGVPTIGIPYDVKIPRLLSLLRLERFVLAPAQPVGPLLEQALGDAWRPDYAVLEREAAAHRAALQEIGS